MSPAHILVAADTPEAGEYLVDYLLPSAGYQVAVADDFTPPPAVDLVLVDINRVRFSPFAGLKAQRRLGCTAPALLVATRVTEQMAMELFSLDVRGFVPKPTDDTQLLREIQSVLARAAQEGDQVRLNQELQHLRDTVARRLNELGTLSRIGRAIAALTNMDTMLSYIAEAGAYLSHADESAIFLVDPASGELQLRAEKGLGRRRAEAIRVPSTDSTAVAVLHTGQPIIRGSGATPEELKVKTGFLVKALINVPIAIGDQIIGVLAAYNHGVQQFNQSDQAALSMLADYAAIVLDKAQTMDAVMARVEALESALRETASLALAVRDPAEALESQAYLLFEGRLGPLTPEQQDAVSRIRLAVERLKEIAEYAQSLGSEAG
jgi:two-component system NtrC family sensor kinase